MDSKLKGSRSQGGLAMQQAQELNALYAAHNTEQNPEKRALIAEQIRVRTGKDRTDKPIAVDMGETISPDGMLKSKNPNVLYDPNTRQVIPLGVGRHNVAGRTLTKEDQAKLGPALKQQGMTAGNTRNNTDSTLAHKGLLMSVLTNFGLPDPSKNKPRLVCLRSLAFPEPVAPPRSAIGRK